MSEPDIRCDWARLTAAHCVDQATNVLRFETGDSACYCDAHTARIHHASRVAPLIRSPLHVSLFLGGLSGWVDALLASLIAAATLDPAVAPVLLDLAEVRGLHLVGSWEARSVEWPRVDRHEHRWIAWERGDEERCWQTIESFGGASRLRRNVHRCPCGMFEHEHAQLRDDGLSEESARTYADLRRRYGGSPTVEERPCDDRDCDMPLGHAGDHYTRWDAGHGNVREESWSDDDRFACLDCGANGHGYHVCPGRPGESDIEEATA
jgi:hypothetical protein